MHKKKILYYPDMYSAFLGSINGIHFTPRELDIVALLLSGRSAKNIALILSLSPKTVENHTQHILEKLKCNTRENVIDFIEKAKELPLIKKHYSTLILSNIFEKSLKEISLYLTQKKISCSLVYWSKDHRTNTFIDTLVSQLKMAGVNASAVFQERAPSLDFFTKEWNQQEILVISSSCPWREEFDNTQIHVKENLQKMGKDTLLLLLREKESDKNVSKERSVMKRLYFDEHKKEYSIAFEIIKYFFSHSALEKIIADFKDQYEILSGESAIIQPLPHKKVMSDEREAAFFLRKKIEGRNKKIYFFLSFIFFALCLGWFFSFQLYKSYITGNFLTKTLKKQEEDSIRSELIVPIDAALLPRPQILKQIDNQFKAHRDNIKIVSLVGIAGAGKTTLARLYARTQKTPIVWEINAETKESMVSSFKELAHFLAKTEEERKELYSIKELQDLGEKERRMFLFITHEIRKYNNWFLIYDNIEEIGEIKKYFPCDTSVWGHGKVIITTKNNNIKNNTIINSSYIDVKELNISEKQFLFTQIIYGEYKTSLTLPQKIELEGFLKNLPPFPLDIATAAYYIKDTKVSYNEYLKRVQTLPSGWENAQERLLKEVGPYTKTRYSLVSLPLQKLINEHPKFIKLLFFISLLDSQNIPKDLLEKYENAIVVEQFLHNLKKSYFISEIITLENKIMLSLHRSIQKNFLDFNINYVNKDEALNDTYKFSVLLEKEMSDALEKSNFEVITLLVRHIRKFLTHRELLNNLSEATLNFILGRAYSYLGYYEDSTNLLEKSQTAFIKLYGQNNKKVFDTLFNLGYCHRSLGNYFKSINYLRQSLKIAEKLFGERHIDTAKVLVELGNSHRCFGNYEISREFIEKALKIYLDKYGTHHIKTAWVMRNLAQVYRELGKYKEATDLITKALVVYRQHYGSENLEMVWSSVYLGHIYRDSGKYEEAKDILEKVYHRTSKCYGGDHIRTAWASGHLGNVYRKLKNYKNSEYLLLKSLSIYTKNYKENDNIELVKIFIELGNLYRDWGQIPKAIEYLTKGVEIFKNNCENNHVLTAWGLKSLGKTYMVKGDTKRAEFLLNQALHIFKVKNHSSAFRVYEDLSDLYLKRASKLQQGKDAYRAHDSKQKALNCLTRALEIIKVSFPENSPHALRIEEKIKQLTGSKRS